MKVEGQLTFSTDREMVDELRVGKSTSVFSFPVNPNTTRSLLAGIAMRFPGSKARSRLIVTNQPERIAREIFLDGR